MHKPVSIRWQPWSPATFTAARETGKLIFVDVGIEGCSACRRMNEVTFSDAAVIELLNQHFVAISVDAEARPDLGQRYSDWAWPALIFMDPRGVQVLAIRGNKTPRSFLPILHRLVTQEREGTLTADSAAPLTVAHELEPAAGLDAVRLQVRGQLDGQLNELLGSWRRDGISASSGARHDHLRFRAHLYDSQELRTLPQELRTLPQELRTLPQELRTLPQELRTLAQELRTLARRSADTHLKLLDQVWGGVYQAYIPGGQANAATRVIAEKRISGQAGALGVFSTAYQLTRDVRYLNGIRRVDEYLQEWLASGEGTYYTSQEDQPVALPARISKAQYWGLRSGHQRRQFGIPPIDHAIYTDKNAEVAIAYVRAYEATSEPNYLGAARQAARQLLAERQTPQGWVQQTGPSARLADDNRMRPQAPEPVPYLSTQATMGLALLALYGATGEGDWLVAARAVANALLTELHDDEAGGFYDRPPSASDVLARRKPLEPNAMAARFFYDLGVYTKEPRYLPIPESTLRATARPGVVRREGKVTAQTGLALERLSASYVEFSVVGDPADEAARTLFEASRVAYHPRKLLHYEAPGRFPVRERPAAYICNPDFCTVAIEDPEEIELRLEEFRQPARSAYP